MTPDGPACLAQDLGCYDFSTIPGEKPKNTYPYNPDDGVIL
jgi:hypothetical protein